jgi:PKD repeat protein
MRKGLMLIVSAFVVFTSQAQDSASVLFIGNSYTYVNNMPDLLVNLSTSLGDVVEYDSQLQGGAMFSTHAGNSSTYTKINSRAWDYVVLQAQSQEPSFPDNQVNTQTLPFAEQMADSVYANNFCSEVLMFMTWGRENGDPQWAPISTFEGMNDRLRNAYLRMSDSVQGSVSPVGVAWRYIRDNNPTIQLYSADGSHPSLEGSYLAACTFYASIFRKSPVGASFISTLDPLVAAELQDAAALTVLDSLDQWNLRPIDEHTQAEFSYTINGGVVTFANESTKAQTYHWDFGDTQTSTDENPIITYTGNGNYTVTLIAESPCDTDTVMYDVNIGGLGVETISNSDVKIASLGDSQFEAISNEPISNIEVLDVMGRVVERTQNSSINLSGQPNGVYTIVVTFNDKRESIRVLK